MRFYEIKQVTDETGTVVSLLNDTAKCYEGQQSGIGKMGECSKNNAKGYASLTGLPGLGTNLGEEIRIFQMRMD